jgi:hypothetical protein
MSGPELPLAVIGLLGLVRDINSAIDRFRKSNQAPKEAECLMARLKTLQGCLEEFYALSKNEESEGTSGTSMEQLKGHLQNLEAVVRDIHNGLVSSSKFKRSWHKLKYFRNPEKIRNHEQTLSGHVESIQTIIATFTA